MDALKQEDRRKFAAQFWIDNRHNGRPYVVKMLKKMGMKQSTIYDVLKRVDNNISPIRRTGSGRPPKKLGPKKVAELISSTVGKIGVSFRKLAKKFKMNDKMVKEVLSRFSINKKRGK